MKLVAMTSGAEPSDTLPTPTSTEFIDVYSAQYGRLVKALTLAGADRSTAEDIAQDAFARSLVHWHRVQNGDNPAGYVYRAAFRLLYRKRKPDLLGVETDNEISTATTHEPDTALRMSVDKVLESMPLRRRSCALLCLVLGFSSPEAAEVLGIADGTVRKHVEQARIDLRAAI